MQTKIAPPADWRAALRASVRDPLELLRLLELPAHLAPERPAPGAFPLRVPRGYVARMRKGDAHDPLLRQVLPTDEENRRVPGFVLDPVGDAQARAASGVLHKYQGRALLVLTGACAVHCRYCFRRHYPYAEEAFAEDAALAHLRADASLGEVILSGGDPLSLGDARLATLVRGLAEIPHVRRVRVHTRLPVVLPERVTDGLLAALAGTRLQSVLVLHVNHAQEIDVQVRDALARLRAAGLWLFNQAVLLRGVNDRVAALAELSEALGAERIVPYYLHLLDKVQGAAHFRVPETEARALLEALRRCLPGYLVPKLVKEVAGRPYKQPL